MQIHVTKTPYLKNNTAQRSLGVKTLLNEAALSKSSPQTPRTMRDSISFLFLIRASSCIFMASIFLCTCNFSIQYVESSILYQFLSFGLYLQIEIKNFNQFLYSPLSSLRIKVGWAESSQTAVYEFCSEDLQWGSHIQYAQQNHILHNNRRHGLDSLFPHRHRTLVHHRMRW